jgi:creatinine amidohydrolase
MEVRMEYMMPREIEEAMTRCPAMYLPLGTIEWHGLHNVAGVDAVKAHELCVRAAQQGGGLVHPPVYGGVGGLTEPHTFIMDEDASMHSVRLRLWLEQLCIEAKRNGFKSILIVTGHYGATQQMTVRETAVRMTKTLAIPVLGTPEYFLALDKEYYGDHAAFFETSIMMHLFPDKVDLSRLGEEPHQGVGGKDPKAFATAEAGQVFCEAIIGRLATLATAMPTWDDATRARFARADDALVSRQIDLAAGGQSVWAAWRRIGEGVFNDYPELLASGRFEEIVKLVEAL